MSSSILTPAATAGHSVVLLPRAIALSLHNDIARAHLSLTVLRKLLRNGQLDDEESSLAELLGYIEAGLERCDDSLGQFMNTPPQGDDHAH